MRKLLLLCAATILAQAAAVQVSAQNAQTQPAQTGDASRPDRQRVLGEVTAVDASAGALTVRTDAGETVVIATDDKTSIRRLPQGETTLDKAVTATLADARAGDRVLASGSFSSGDGARRLSARQLVLTARAAAGQGRDDGRRLLGRVVSVDASKKLIVVQTRGREGVETVSVDASGATRVLRYAPDSARVADAQAASFADVRVGDQLRATGERAAEAGGAFRAEEIIAGSFTRIAGQIVSVDAARGELTLKNEQTGDTFRVTVGQRTTLRRVTPEFVKTMTERAERREQQRRAEGGGQSANNNGDARGTRPEGAAREGGRREGGREGRGGAGRGEGGRRGEGGGGRFGGGGAGGGNMFDNLPAVTLAELKKGEGVLITATPGADASTATAVSVVAGDAEFLRRMQQRGDGGGQRGMSPGLPGDVIGGGTGGSREPPRQ